ncbi:hypothetical protein B0H11DRAFT_1934764 [Mycena galericulata]|nr:hypothetical protein B0H11DRAFT_1934764 [Mycena galericulata]
MSSRRVTIEEEEEPRPRNASPPLADTGLIIDTDVHSLEASTTPRPISRSAVDSSMLMEEEEEEDEGLLDNIGASQRSFFLEEQEEDVPIALPYSPPSLHGHTGPHLPLSAMDLRHAAEEEETEPVFSRLEDEEGDVPGSSGGAGSSSERQEEEGIARNVPTPPVPPAPPAISRAGALCHLVRFLPPFHAGFPSAIPPLPDTPDMFSGRRSGPDLRPSEPSHGLDHIISSGSILQWPSVRTLHHLPSSHVISVAVPPVPIGPPVPPALWMFPTVVHVSVVKRVCVILHYYVFPFYPSSSLLSLTNLSHAFPFWYTTYCYVPESSDLSILGITIEDLSI